MADAVGVARGAPSGLERHLLLAASVQHFMRSYGVVMDSSMLANSLHTNWTEAWALLTPALLVQVLLLVGLPMAWLYWGVQMQAPAPGLAALGLVAGEERWACWLAVVCACTAIWPRCCATTRKFAIWSIRWPRWSASADAVALQARF